VIDPNSSKGTVSAIVTLAMPLKNALSKADTTYSISLDLGALAVDKLAMNQKLEASSLKVVADNQGYRVKATSRSRDNLHRLTIAKTATATPTFVWPPRSMMRHAHVSASISDQASAALFRSS
jgi:hypothetical protein